MNVKKALRINLGREGLTQASLAAKAGVTEATISRMVKDNETSTKVLRPICEVLGITMSEFMKDGE